MSFDFAQIDVGVYLLDTAHLSLIEQGAYWVMLANYYRSGKPLPSSEKQLFSITRAVTVEEKKAVRAVAKEFFVERHGKLFNARADAELEKRQKYSDEMKKKASARWGRKK